MDSTTTSVCSTLPFDVLAHIFSHYAVTETVYHPIETLLLVCRWWRDVALEHRALWTHLNVHISLCGDISSVKIWRTRLPLRLKRVGDTLPLHIELRHLPSHMPSDNVHYWELQHRLSRPMGCPVRRNINPQARCQGGELCKRWSTLYLDLHNPSRYGVEYQQLGHFVHHPMPILTSATIRVAGKGIGLGSFPHTPLLRRLVIDGSIVSPSLHTVRSLSLVKSHWRIYEIPNEASNTEELELEGSFRLPISLPNLWRLQVAGALYRPGNEVTQLPKLTHLEIKNRGPQQHDALGTGKGIDLSHLVALAIHLDIDSSYSKFKINVQEILRRSKNLSIIQGNLKGISMILKLVWDTEAEWNETRNHVQREWKDVRLLADQEISIEAEGESARLLGDEACDQLCDVAARLKVDLPDAGWDDIFGENNQYWG